MENMFFPGTRVTQEYNFKSRLFQNPVDLICPWDSNPPKYFFLTTELKFMIEM